MELVDGSQGPREARPVGLVTGASTGLGEQFALLLARHGFDVVLVSRSAARLEAVRERLRPHRATGYVVPADLCTAEGVRTVQDAVAARGLAVEVLINNAGAGTSGPFLDLPSDAQTGLLALNCGAVLALTHHFGRQMRDRGHGRILTIASTAGFVPGPYMATYYATKAFVLSFSEALAVELKGSGVTVTCSCPGRVDTGFARKAGTEGRWRPGVMRADDVAHQAFEAMLQGEVVAVHGALNWLSTVVARLAPRAAARAMSASLNAPG